MATMETTYLLRLNTEEAGVLAKALSGMDDTDLAMIGIRDKDRERLQDIYDVLSRIEE